MDADYSWQRRESERNDCKLGRPWRSLGEKCCGVVSGRQEDKFKTSGLTVNFKNNIPFVDEGNFICLCKKMAAVPITEAHFLDPEIKEKWYSGKEEYNLHTLYIGELLEVLAR